MGLKLNEVSALLSAQRREKFEALAQAKDILSAKRAPVAARKAGPSATRRTFKQAFV